MDNNSQNILEKMAAFLDSQTERYREILEMSKKQSECIKANDTASLMKVLTAKQDAIRGVDESSKEAEAVLAEWDRVRDNFSSAEKSELEKKHEELKGILAEVMDLEEDGRTSLSNKMGDTGSKITKMQKGKQMLKAYGANMPKKSNYTDNNG
ncbi:MAG: flagellar export chaperone FlgN [Planctomycetota bacterium]